MLYTLLSHDAIDITDTLSNLNYLIRHDAGDALLVRSYVDEVEGQLRLLADLLRLAASEMTSVQM